MRYTLPITTKGSVIIPADLRRRLGIKPGDQINLWEDPTNKQQLVIQPALSWEDLQKKNRHLLQRKGVAPLSDEELDTAINTSWANTALHKVQK